MLKFFLVLVVSWPTLAQTARTCSFNQRLELLFLNGIRNDRGEAVGSLDKIQNLVNKQSTSSTSVSPNGTSDICYKLLYNQTEEYLDFIEVLAQKIREADPTQSENQIYQKVSKFLILNESPTLSGEEVDWSKLVAEHFARTEYHTLHVETAPIVIKDLKERSVLVVSHSQGNLFANLIYGEMQRDTTLTPRFKNYANLQVGSAAATIQAEKGSYGDYMTSKQDDVIGGLNLFFEVLDPNVEMNYVLESLGGTGFIRKYDYAQYDPSGHGFVEVYTNSKVNGKLDGETDFRSMSSIFMDKLEGLAQQIIEPKCSGEETTESNFRICMQVLSAPSDRMGNVEFEITSCNNEPEYQEFAEVFEDNLVPFFKSNMNNPRIATQWKNLSEYRVDEQKLIYSVPADYFRYGLVRNNLDLKILQKEFVINENEKQLCNDTLSANVTFLKHGIFCKNPYYKHDDYGVMISTDSIFEISKDANGEIVDFVKTDSREQYGNCSDGSEYTRCSLPSKSAGLICNGSQVRDSHVGWGGIVMGSSVNHSIIANGYMALNSSINGTYLEVSSVNSSITGGAYLPDLPYACPVPPPVDHIIYSESLFDSFGELQYSGGGGNGYCFSQYKLDMYIKTCTSDSCPSFEAHPEYPALYVKSFDDANVVNGVVSFPE